MEMLQYWQLLAGLGIFLYGMMQMEQGLSGLGSDTFTAFLRNQTKTPWRGVAGGIFATFFLQSSTVVGLIVLAFVGAGILELRHALGIMLGANIGSTFTGWIVTFVGFKLDLDNLSLPLLAIGSLMTIYFKPASRRCMTGKLLLGFGFLLFGLANMKNSVESVVNLENIVGVIDYPPVIFLLVAALFTAIIHSSAGTMMLVLSALHSGIIDLPSAAALAIGADIGTTSTLLLGGMKGSADKKRVAVAHLVFNIITNSIAFMLLMPLLSFIQDILGVKDPLYALVTFHTAFNVLGVCLFMPFLARAANRLEAMFNRPALIATAFIPALPASISKDVIDAVIMAVENETRRLLFKVLLLQARTFKLEEGSILTLQQKQVYRIEDSEHRYTYEESYTELKEIEGELMAYIYTVQNNTSYPQESERLSELHHAIHMMVYAAKTIKDIRHDLMDIRHTQHIPAELDQELLAKAIRHFCHQCIHLQGINNTSVYKEGWLDLQGWVNREYEQRKQALIASARSSAMSDIHLSTLLHINKAILLAHNALLEAVEIKNT